MAANACIFSSKYGLQRELPLASGISIGKIQEIGRRSILDREGFDSNRVIVLHEGSADSRQTARKIRMQSQRETKRDIGLPES